MARGGSRRRAAPQDGAAAAALFGGLSRNAPDKDGLAWGLEIHRWVEPRDWPQALERVPAEHRARAEEYLRGIAQRMRNLRALKGAR